MAELRTVRPIDPKYQEAVALEMANYLNCGRCQARLWFWHEPSETDEVESLTALFTEHTTREGCSRCDPEGHALAKQHYHQVLDIHQNRWPGEEIDIDHQVVPQPAQVQSGLERRLNGLVRVEWEGRDGEQRGRFRRNLLRVQPQVGQDNLVPEIVDALNSASISGSTSFTVDVILQAEDGSELRRGKALV